MTGDTPAHIFGGKHYAVNCKHLTPAETVKTREIL